MVRRSILFVASLLLVLSLLVDGWDWWTTHDLDVLELVRRAPVLGASLEKAMGADSRRPDVRLAVDASYPPFAQVNPNGSLAGFEVELAEELGSRLALSSRVVNMDAGDAVFDALVANRIDAVIAGLTYYPDVTKDIAYSNGYFEAGPVLFARSGDGRITTLDELKEMTVAVEAGSLGEEEARKLSARQGGVTLLPMADVSRVVASLAGGEVDAAILDRASIPPDSPHLSEVRFVAGPLRSLPYSVAVRRKDPALLLAINRELEEMRSSGLLEKLERRWFP